MLHAAPAGSTAVALRAPAPARAVPPPRRGDARAGRVARLHGLAAEAAVARHYAAAGGRVLERRWRCPEGEIDLVVDLGPTLAFVEVKARRDAIAAAEALRPGQARRLRAAAARFLAERGRPEGRIDVVLVTGDGRTTCIENAVGFDEW